MLVLGRREGESVVLADAAGNEIATVTVVRAEHGRVRIGIDAGPEVQIHRDAVRRPAA